MNTVEKYIIQPQLQGHDARACQEISCELGIPYVLAELLYQRGFVTVNSARNYLRPSLADLPSPFQLKGMHQAVELILAAVATKGQVVIHGDYDVDGITATVLLVDFLSGLGLEVSYHLPNRMKEGYGLSRYSIDVLAEKVSMPALLITVDCGITATEEVRYAQEIGFKVIVTDHHEPPCKLPDADALINPRQQDCEFSFKGLSGVGVAFFLAMAVRRKMVEKGFWERNAVPNLKDCLDLVALGTVADVMELVGINRILVKAGLEVITARKRPGIWALCECSKMMERVVTAEDISFRLAPRINAAGRLGIPYLAADLLCSTDIDEALDRANALEQANLKRRKLERLALDDALELAGEQVADNRKGLVLLGTDWHPGVVGIIAARVADRFQLPVLVFTRDRASGAEIFKGSGRSVSGLNLFTVLQQSDSHILQFGGHAMAAGLTVAAEEFAAFCTEFNSSVQKMIRDVDTPGLLIDRIMNTGDDCRELTRCLSLMEPFGQGNPEPVFLLNNIRMERVSTLREHLKFFVRINGSKVQGIGFFMAEQFDLASHQVDLGFKLKQTSFRGRERIEAHAVAIIPTS